MTTIGTIYVIGAPDGLPVKVGYTEADPYQRLASLQTGSFRPLEVLAQAPGSYWDEMRLHERLAAHRVRGEWFERTEAAEAVTRRLFLSIQTERATCRVYMSQERERAAARVMEPLIAPSGHDRQHLERIAQMLDGHVGHAAHMAWGLLRPTASELQRLASGLSWTRTTVEDVLAVWLPEVYGC